jgi:membrane protein YdbS with pleckstrin-like domain
MLTALVVWACPKFLPADLLWMTVGTLIAAIWSMQLIRWAYRVLGYRYRLTNEGLYHGKGWLYAGTARTGFAEIKRVSSSRGFIGIVTQVGNVSVEVAEGEKSTIVLLEGVRLPQLVAAKIQERIG